MMAAPLASEAPWRIFACAREEFAIVLRLETSDGTGIYRGGAVRLAERIIGLSLFSESTPVPEVEWGDSPDLKAQFEGSIFGFLSHDSLKRWFPLAEARRTLDQIGVQTCVYRVPSLKIRLGASQIAFPQRTAFKLGRLPLAEV